MPNALNKINSVLLDVNVCIDSLAEENGIDIIITSNISDFSRSSIPVYRPADSITLFN